MSFFLTQTGSAETIALLMVASICVASLILTTIGGLRDK